MPKICTTTSPFTLLEIAELTRLNLLVVQSWSARGFIECNTQIVTGTGAICAFPNFFDVIAFNVSSTLQQMGYPISRALVIGGDVTSFLAEFMDIANDQDPFGAKRTSQIKKFFYQEQFGFETNELKSVLNAVLKPCQRLRMKLVYGGV